MKIGIDVGGTNLAAGCVDNQGKILLKKAFPTGAGDGYSAVLERLIGLIDELTASCNTHDSVTAIGLGVPGIVSPDGVSATCVNLFWDKVPLKNDLEAHCGLPVYLANDATAAGIAENRYGSSKGIDNAVMLTIGTGIGGCIIINGKIINGSFGVASEIGHIHVGDGLYACNCGKSGCLETYASATGLIRQAQMAIERGEPTSILQSAKGNPSNINAKMVMDAAKAGDAVGLQCFHSMVSHLATAMSIITDVIDPKLYVIGGGVANAGDFLFTALQKAFKDRLTYPQFAYPEIVPAHFKNDAGIIGAACINDYL